MYMYVGIKRNYNTQVLLRYSINLHFKVNYKINIITAIKLVQFLPTFSTLSLSSKIKQCISVLQLTQRISEPGITNAGIYFILTSMLNK